MQADQTTIFALSCTDGPCNPIAGGTGTLTFTYAPDSKYRPFRTSQSPLTWPAFIYTASLQGGMDYDLRCTLKGCPEISEVKCVTSKNTDGGLAVDIGYPTYTERMPLSLDEEVPEVTSIECPTTAAPPKETGSSDDDDGEEGDSDDSGADDEGSNEGSDEEDSDGDEGSALANVPFFGLVAGAAAGAAAVLL